MSQLTVSEKMETKVCWFFPRGRCWNGDYCKFLHVHQELPPKQKKPQLPNPVEEPRPPIDNTQQQQQQKKKKKKNPRQGKQERTVVLRDESLARSTQPQLIAVWYEYRDPISSQSRWRLSTETRPSLCNQCMLMRTSGCRMTVFSCVH